MRVCYYDKQLSMCIVQPDIKQYSDLFLFKNVEENMFPNGNLFLSMVLKILIIKSLKIDWTTIALPSK